MKSGISHPLSLCTAAIVAASYAGCASSHEHRVNATDSGVRDATTPDTRGPTPNTRDTRDTRNTPDAAQSALHPDAQSAGSFCALPGSYVGTDNGMQVVPGGDPSLPDLSWLKVPAGYCVHHFAHVDEARQVRMSPSGDLFVAAPSKSTAGGESKLGPGAIIVLPDDNHDGVADSALTFLDNLPATHGLTFAGHYLYFQDGTALKRVAVKAGDHAPTSDVESVTTITDKDAQQFPFHWPKVVDVAKDGTVYFTNGSDQGEQCYSPGEKAKHPPTGVVFKVSPAGKLSVVAQGFRNPIAIRCEKTVNVCLIAELARDGSGAQGGREKLVPVRPGDDWGFPCCATQRAPYDGQRFQDPVGQPLSGQTLEPSDCASVTPEDVSFEIGDTPFDIAFEDGGWAAPWGNRAFVALHGAVGSFIGSRVVSITLDPTTGLPLASSDLHGDASDGVNMQDFVTGWDDRTTLHGRATTLTFGNDGRLYIGDDTRGEIFWIAPVGLMRPSKQ